MTCGVVEQRARSGWGGGLAGGNPSVDNVVIKLKPYDEDHHEMMTTTSLFHWIMSMVLVIYYMVRQLVSVPC